MQIMMSQVEALLSVDAGRVPVGTVAFFPRDPEAQKRRICTVLAFVVLGVGVGLVFAGLRPAAVPLLALVGVALAVGALPTKSDSDSPPTKSPTLVLTQEGMIVRDGEGLRYWHFEDLADVRPYLYGQTLGLLVLRKDGKRDFVDTTFFERGERVRELIGRHLKPREA
jgi:hypothetical protein